jgi:hypothetical protein
MPSFLCNWNKRSAFARSSTVITDRVKEAREFLRGLMCFANFFGTGDSKSQSGATDAINVMAMHGTGRSRPLANPPATGNAETIRPIKPLAEHGYGS